MKKLFRTLIAVTLLAAPAGHPRRFNVFKPLASRVQVIGPGLPLTALRRSDLARLTVKDLRKLASTMKIKGRSKARRKAELVTLIQKAGVR
jgi:integrase